MEVLLLPQHLSEENPQANPTSFHASLAHASPHWDADHLRPMSHDFITRRKDLRPYPYLFHVPGEKHAIGILAEQWMIYHRVMEVGPVNVDAIVKAAVALHNFQELSTRSYHLTRRKDDHFTSICENR